MLWAYFLYCVCIIFILSIEESKEGSRYISGDGVTTIHKPADFPLNKYRKYLESIVPILYTDEATEVSILKDLKILQTYNSTEFYILQFFNSLLYFGESNSILIEYT